MARSLTVDFYRVVMPNGAPAPFESVVHRVGQSPLTDGRNVDVRGEPIRLQEYGEWNHCIEGDMVRIRMDMLPRKASLDGELTDLDLEPDEGLGEETAFVYHSTTGVLVIQRNRSGVSATALAAYFQRKAGLEDAIDLEPVLQRDALQRLTQMRVIRRFSVTVSGLERGELVRDQPNSVRDVVRLSNEFQAPTITFTVSMGRQRRGSLLLEQVRNAARSFYRMASRNEEQVQKIEISGVGDGDERQVLDLLEYRLKETFPIEEGRTVGYETRQYLLRRAWMNNQEHLREMLGRRV